MDKKQMTVLLIEPETRPKEVTIDSGLESLQKAVGGWIEAIYPFDEEVALICNDEGKLMGLPPNRVLRRPETGTIYDIVVGTFFLCAAPAARENFESLTEEQIRRYTEYFSTPEFFI